MLLSASEGRHWRYEVCEHSDGYLVQMRDLETGDLHETFATIFRTLPVAFAYADMSAALDRYAAAELESIDDVSFAMDLQTSESHFIQLSESLQDRGMEGSALMDWERVARATPETRVLH
jgi:hypothetical protein